MGNFIYVEILGIEILFGIVYDNVLYYLFLLLCEIEIIINGNFLKREIFFWCVGERLGWVV